MSYHNRIMMLPGKDSAAFDTVQDAIAYKSGHRDARHAAAEIATEADTEIDKLRRLLAKALPLIEAEANNRDAAFISDSMVMETEQSTIHYWTEMRELANAIAKEKGFE